MKEFITKIDEETGEPVVDVFHSISRYIYKNGYTLEGVDLGFSGVKITMSHPQYESATILLEPIEIDKFAFWLLKTISQKVPRLPNKLAIVLRRIVDKKGYDVKLEKGDKKVFRDTLTVMAEVLYHEELKAKTLRTAKNE